METGLINPFMLRILIAARAIDSIYGIAKRINLSYGWTYKWVNELVKLGVFKRVKNKIAVCESHDFYKNTIQYVKKIFEDDVGFHYSVLSLFGIKYCFAKTDAVFVWTKGGYNIGRSKQFYPIFIKIKNDNRSLFEYYAKKLSLQMRARNGVFYNIEYVDDFEVEYCDGIPVESLNESINFMKKYIYNFQPALEMIDEMYRKDTRIRYKEAVVHA